MQMPEESATAANDSHDDASLAKRRPSRIVKPNSKYNNDQNAAPSPLGRKKARHEPAPPAPVTTSVQAPEPGAEPEQPPQEPTPAPETEQAQEPDSEPEQLPETVVAPQKQEPAQPPVPATPAPSTTPATPTPTRTTARALSRALASAPSGAPAPPSRAQSRTIAPTPSPAPSQSPSPSPAPPQATSLAHSPNYLVERKKHTPLSISPSPKLTVNGKVRGRPRKYFKAEPGEPSPIPRIARATRIGRPSAASLNELNQQQAEDLNRKNEEIEQLKSRVEELTNDLESLKRQCSYTGQTIPKIDHDRMIEKHKVELREAKRREWCVCCSEPSRYYCCWNTTYCSTDCQVSDWYKKHKSYCLRLRKKAVASHNT